MAEKSERNGKESCQKRLVKQRKHYLSLARKSFRNQKNMKLEIFVKNLRESV